MAQWLYSRNDDNFQSWDCGIINIHTLNDDAFQYASCGNGDLFMAEWLYSLGVFLSNSYIHALALHLT